MTDFLKWLWADDGFATFLVKLIGGAMAIIAWVVLLSAAIALSQATLAVILSFAPLAAAVLVAYIQWRLEQ